MPHLSSRNIFVCVRLSFIEFFHHDLTLPDAFHCLTQLGESIARPCQPWIFESCVCNWGLQKHWSRASNIIPKHVCLCGMKFYLVVQWLTHFATCFFHWLTRLDSSMDRTSQPWICVCYILTNELAWFWKASDIIPKHVCLCGMKFYWVVQWLTHFAAYCFTAWQV